MEKLKQYAIEILGGGASTMIGFFFGGFFLAILIMVGFFLFWCFFGTAWAKDAQIKRVERNARREAREYRRLCRRERRA